MNDLENPYMTFETAHSMLEVDGVWEYVVFTTVSGHNACDIYLDEGDVNSLYEFLGEWIDVNT